MAMEISHPSNNISLLTLFWRRGNLGLEHTIWKMMEITEMQKYLLGIKAC